MTRVLLPCLLGWGSCRPDKDTGDTALPPECDFVTAACPPGGERAYWSTCDGGGWDHVEECWGSECRPAEHGEVRMVGADGEVWSDVWATCSAGYGHLEGVIRCYP